MPDNLRINIRAMTPDERGFAYTQPELLEVSGCIGHLRVDMGNTGTQFFFLMGRSPGGFENSGFQG